MDLLFDPFAGISGDMTVAALHDLGLPEAWLPDFVAGLGLGDIAVAVTRTMRRGIACTKVDFHLPDEHAHRHLRHVVEIIERSRAPARAKERAVDAFRRIAVAEAAVHGTTVEKVHFHEVGALDAILDILCTMAALDQLGVERCHTRPVALGSGWVDIAHGRYPVPAPATLRILEGLPVTGADLAGECTTPTGAAILATLTDGTAPSSFTPLRTGFGAGTRDPEDRPNCLRVVALETTASDALVLVQTDVDDLAPEYVPPAQQAVLDAGALDVVVVPVQMKKGRPGLRLEALVPVDRLDDVVGTLFRVTPTIGVRHWPVRRPALPRAEETRVWRGQPIRFKRVTLPDGTQRRKPEFEDVVEAARNLGLSALEVRAALAEDGGSGTADGPAGTA